MTKRLHRAERYIQNVLDGKIDVCKWVRLACKRHADDLRLAEKGKCNFYFDYQSAQYAEDFFAEVLKHPKDSIKSNAGDPFVLEPWELAMIIWPLFGWKRLDGTRRYNRAYIEVPKKNGKSSISAGLAALLLFADGEYAAEVYSVSGSREQAAIIFDISKSMIERSPELVERAEIFRRVITYRDAYSVYKVLSADAPMAHGINAHGILFDELHVQPNRDLFDALWGAGKARRQPLFLMLTTAGYDRQSICYEMRNYAQQILDGVKTDDTFWAVIYTIDEGDDWLSPKVWKKANPNLGITISKATVAEEAKQAAAIPGYQNTFKRFALSIWTEQESRLITSEMWETCYRAAPALEGQECFGGLDLASSSDIASFVLDFGGDEDEQRWLPFFWIPEDNMLERAHKDGVPYDAWVRDGLIYATPGNVIDHRQIMADIEKLGKVYQIKEIAYDRWGAREISQQLMDAGFTIVEFGQGMKSMAAPTKEFVRLVASGRLLHDGNPVLRWMANNLVATSDPAGNLKPDKQKSREKIDGIVAGIMALDRALRHKSEGGSVYDKRGLLVL